MLIPHPLLGPRDSQEFVILGDASLINRPNWQASDVDNAFFEYQYLRDNPAGIHRELWYHEMGDHSWLIVTRDTITHEVVKVELASEAASSKKPQTRGSK